MKRLAKSYSVAQGHRQGASWCLEAASTAAANCQSKHNLPFKIMATIQGQCKGTYKCSMKLRAKLYKHDCQWLRQWFTHQSCIMEGVPHRMSANYPSSTGQGITRQGEGLERLLTTCCHINVQTDLRQVPEVSSTDGRIFISTTNDFLPVITCNTEREASVSGAVSALR